MLNDYYVISLGFVRFHSDKVTATSANEAEQIVLSKWNNKVIIVGIQAVPGQYFTMAQHIESERLAGEFRG